MKGTADQMSAVVSVSVQAGPLFDGRSHPEGEEPPDAEQKFEECTPVPPGEMSIMIDQREAQLQSHRVVDSNNNNNSSDSPHRIQVPKESCDSDEKGSFSETQFDGLHWRGIWRKTLSQYSITRTAHEQELLNFYEQATSSTRDSDHKHAQKLNFILVSGPLGSDMPGLSNVVHPILKRKNGYFIKGKFDSIPRTGSSSEMRRPIPYEAFLDAFTEFIHLTVDEGEAAVLHLCDVLYSQLSTSELHVLMSRVPALEFALKYKQDLSPASISSPPEEKNIGASSKKFIFAFRKFVRAMGSMGCPVVMQLENLHHADRSSVDVLLGLVADAMQAPGLVIVATCPLEYIKGVATDSTLFCYDNYLLTKWVELEVACGGTIPMISLQHLTTAEVSNFLLNAFHLVVQQDVEQFVQMVIAQSGGNQVYLLEFIEWLCTSGHLKLVDENKDNKSTWSWNEVQNTAVFGLSHQCFLLHKFKKLTNQEREFIKISSCLGSSFDKQHIEYIIGHPVATVCDSLEHQGIILQTTTGRKLHQFCHDGLQQAAYELIAQNEKDLFHLEVGRRLWRKLDHNAVDRHLFLFLSQIHLGRSLIGREKEQVAVATLSLHAGQKAAQMSSFRIALVYLNFGIEMLSPLQSWKDHYDLSLALYTNAVEMEVCASNFDDVDCKVSQIVSNTQSYDDQVPAHATKMLGLSLQNNFSACIELGVEVLKKLGVSWPHHISKRYLLREAASIRRLLRGKSDEQILRIPYLTDETQLRIMHIFGLMLFSAMASMERYLTFLIIVKMMKISLEEGLCAMSSFAFCNYGFAVVNAGRTEAGLRYGNLALKLLDSFQALELLPRVYCLYYGMIHPLAHPISEALESLQYARDVAFQTGDFEYATLCGHGCGWISIARGFPLEGVLNQWTNFGDFFQKKNQTTSLFHTALYSLQFVHHVMGKTDNPLAAKGDLLDFDDTGDGKENFLPWDKYEIAFNRMKLAYLFDDIEMADNFCIHPKELKMIPPSFKRVSLGFLIGLVCVGCARKGIKRRQKISTATLMVKGLRKWAELGPHNFSDKAFLLEAELASVGGKAGKAYKNYFYACAVAKETENFFMSGLSNECFAKHLVIEAKHEEAKLRFEEALNAYEKWQAHAKVQHLRNYIHDLYDVPST